jgi:very-short-patch-repair endonuclease
MDTKESLQHREKLKFKRALRRNLTPAEQVLWQELRGRKLLKSKWRRQENIGQFIADFLCKEHKLIVEVDGGIHELQREYDQLRTEIINVYGYRVIRFANKEILENAPLVLEKIAKELSHSPSPASGEGARG